MSDRYSCFAALAEKSLEGKHYRIVLADRQSPVVVMAPHGGTIEPGTSEIATKIAATSYSLYCFEALQPGGEHCDFHITSDKFDEPRAIALASSAEIVITVHGRRDRDDPAVCYLGGRRADLVMSVATCLIDAGFPSQVGNHKFPATRPANICNRGRSGGGLQLEIPMSLRDKLVQDDDLLNSFSHAVRVATEVIIS